MRSGRRKSWWRSRSGDGRAAERIADILMGQYMLYSDAYRFPGENRLTPRLSLAVWKMRMMVPRKGGISMKRDEVLALLRGYRAELEEYGVKSLAIFGSVARNEETDRSDVDILVEFGRPVSSNSCGSKTILKKYFIGPLTW